MLKIITKYRPTNKSHNFYTKLKNRLTGPYELAVYRDLTDSRLADSVNDLKYKTQIYLERILQFLYMYDKMVQYVLISQAKKINLCMKWLPVIDRLCWSFKHAEFLFLLKETSEQQRDNFEHHLRAQGIFPSDSEPGEKSHVH